MNTHSVLARGLHTPRMHSHLTVLERSCPGSQQCVGSVSALYLPSQCTQCHPEGLQTLGLSPFAEGALGSYWSSDVRTQESAAEIKKKYFYEE